MKVGKKYNNLTITQNTSEYKVMAICDCGIEKEFYAANIYCGKSASCGCMNRKASSNRFKKYNSTRTSKFTPSLTESHGLSHHPLYTVWLSMMKRCYDENDISYKRYGGKGVIVCEEWKNDFLNFYNWGLVNGYQKGLQLDKDYKGDGKIYSPETCQFITRSLNCRNRTTSKFIEYNGETKTLAEWCEIYNIGHTVVLSRISRGWPTSEIFKPSKRAA